MSQEPQDEQPINFDEERDHAEENAALQAGIVQARMGK